MDLNILVCIQIMWQLYVHYGVFIDVVFNANIITDDINAAFKYIQSAA